VKKAILEARQEVSKQEILNVAKRLFAEQGVRATSLAKIAEVVGVTKAALYHYFASKHEIVLEAVRANVRDFDQDVLEPTADLSASQMLVERLERKVARAERDGPLDLRFFYAVLLEEIGEPDIEAVIREFWAKGRRELTDFVRAGQRSGEFRDDIDLGVVLDVLSGAIMGIDILWLNDPKLVDLRAAYSMALEQTLAVLAPRASRAS
jgi:AcrR family transcriptional regulator